MSEQLQGRELSRAVHAAMHGTPTLLQLTVVRRYAENADAIAEMIAWLTRRQDHLEIDCWANGNDGKPGVSAVLSVDDNWTSPYVEGATLNEALCRLVLAVSKQATGAAGEGEAP